MLDKKPLPLFQQQQYALAAHLRNPDNVLPPKGVEARRIGIYRDLLLNNMSGFIDNAFPVLNQLYNPARWQQLIRLFLATHHSTSPYFSDIPKAFFSFLQASYQMNSGDFPFLIELAHYEWVELDLINNQVVFDDDSINKNGRLLDQTPILSPNAKCYGYQWPVHQISAYYQPLKPLDEPVFIILYYHENKVQFLEANMITAHLFELLQLKQEVTGLQLLTTIANKMNASQFDGVIKGGLHTLQQWQQLGIIVGCR